MGSAPKPAASFTPLVPRASAQQFLGCSPTRYYDLESPPLPRSIEDRHLEPGALDPTPAAPASAFPMWRRSVTLQGCRHTRRGPRSLSIKCAPRKKTRRKNGHRQELTVIGSSRSRGGPNRSSWIASGLHARLGWVLNSLSLPLDICFPWPHKKGHRLQPVTPRSNFQAFGASRRYGG